MIEKKGDIWKITGDNDIIVITTNGFVKANGECVMGRGIALAAKKRFGYIPKLLGDYIRKYGNRPFRLGNGIVSFPVKPASSVLTASSHVVSHMKDKFNLGDTVPGWACIADINIIVDSAHKLVAMADKFDWHRVFMPRPGCGAGQLDWSKVKNHLSAILDDRFIICTF